MVTDGTSRQLHLIKEVINDRPITNKPTSFDSSLKLISRVQEQYIAFSKLLSNSFDH